MTEPPPRKATAQSWSRVRALPVQRARLTIERAYSYEEYERICRGFVPEVMEDKWFMYVQDDTLYVHRSWTGACIYQLAFIADATRYVAGEAWANRDPSQYAGADDAYDAALLAYLIDYYLLGQKKMLPMPTIVTAGIATELHHHHVLGAGQRTEREPYQVTMRGMAAWLVRWLISLVRK